MNLFLTPNYNKKIEILFKGRLFFCTWWIKYIDYNKIIILLPIAETGNLVVDLVFWVINYVIYFLSTEAYQNA